MLFAIGRKGHLRTRLKRASECMLAARHLEKVRRTRVCSEGCRWWDKMMQVFSRINQQFPQTVHSRFSFLLRFFFQFYCAAAQTSSHPLDATHKNDTQARKEQCTWGKMEWTNLYTATMSWKKKRCLILTQGDCWQSPQLWLSRWAAAAAHWCSTLMMFESSIYMQYIYPWWQTHFKNSF